MEKKSNKKKILSIVSLSVLVVGIGSYFYMTKDVRKVEAAKEAGKDLLCISTRGNVKGQSDEYWVEGFAVHFRGTTRTFNPKYCFAKK